MIVCGSYRKVVVVPPAAVALLVLYGEVTRRLLGPILPFTAFPSRAVFLI